MNCASMTSGLRSIIRLPLCSRPRPHSALGFFRSSRALLFPSDTDSGASSSGGSQPDFVLPSDGLSISKITRKLWLQRTIHDPDGEAQQVFIEKSPADSLVSVNYNFTTDFELRGHYTNLTNRLRIGALLEDMDALAGNVAHLHVDDGNPATRPVSIVTASVDKIQLKRPRYLTLDRDIEMIGRPVFTGRSSMEILIHLRAERTILNAYFTMVAVDPLTHRSTRINSLTPQTDQEQKWHAEGKVRRDAKRACQDLALDRHPPTATESALIHSLLAKSPRHAICSIPIRFDRHLSPSLKLPDGPMVAMGRGLSRTDGGAWYAGDRAEVADGTRRTHLSSINLCNPQMRNLHGNIFGGFLMRKAYETAWCVAHSFLRTTPILVETSTISFHRPVQVGSILHCDAMVTYVDVGNPPLVVVQAEMAVLSVLDGSARSTNSFFFVFTPERDVNVPMVRPTTYDEALAYLEGRRIVADIRKPAC
eukprot:TRINITY_DN6608_c1_g3_i1.p1 TRINITY_DN6608_c1_g3~~TRINITY_DN6608_c1_g3_i1.p1  ORF type:complete len:478 (+),score=72.00 TRINITY_DN6608_c1_g3_i1:33-1466(+)